MISLQKSHSTFGNFKISRNFQDFGPTKPNSKTSRIRLLTQPYSNDPKTQWLVSLLIFKDIIVYFRFPSYSRRGTAISTNGQNSVLVFKSEFPAS
jgi:hypothetical protein